MNREVRVRFAPSPTGPLHIGGVRTALYNYLFARKHNGKFILRIEDTDQQRFVPGAEEYIIESLTWCGIKFDEGVHIGGPYGPYKQSERKAIYKQYADYLIAKGSAYYAFDTAEELESLRKQYEAEKKTFQYDIHTRTSLKNSLTLSKQETQDWINAGKPYVVRFKMPENRILQLHDLIRGEVTVNTSTLDDKVLFKSDGLPTYHLANIVDDHLMQISHVIRGEEWLPSLPLHYLLYEAFEWTDTMPLFAHLPLLLKPDGKGKLSKRDGDRLGFPVFPCNWHNPDGELYPGFREWGYLPQAFINMLALLGWNPGTDQELFSLNELVELFTIERVNKSGARFDPEKAKWFNQQYLKKLSNDELTELIKPIILERGINTTPEKLHKVIGLLKERAIFPQDIINEGIYFFQKPLQYDDAAIKKRIKPTSINFLEQLIDDLNSCNFANEELETAMNTFCQQHQLGLGEIMIPIRIALVGTTKGPHLGEIMEVLGKKESIDRITTFISYLKQFAF
ncbi:MAG: glutamate--tRNA ligase [Bacteroidales bacterium]|nr:glutamate--tRNA ligase [Bacteroidales bacterium]